MNRITFILLSLIVFLPQSGAPLHAQTREVDPNRNYWGDLDAFYNRQAEVSLEAVEEALIRFPPRIPESLVRRMALLLLDGVFHEPGAPERPAVQAFFHDAMEQAADELESTRPTRGSMIWKLYDHGFVARTSSVTIGFDLVRGTSAGVDEFTLPDDIMERIIDQCDVLFISHRHRDHADYRVAQSFLDRGRPVVAPVEIWADSTLHGSITHLTPQAHEIQTLSVRGGMVDLQVVVYPGHQGADIPNSVFLIMTPEGISICQTGDQSNRDDFSWIDEVSLHHSVDILLPNCWTTDIDRLTRGFDPQLVITGHENELGHSVDHREPYWLTWDRLSLTNYPLLVMTWGESFHYDPR